MKYMQTVKMHATLKKLLNLIINVMIFQDDNHNHNVDDCKEDYYNKDDSDDGSCDDDDDVDGGIGADKDDDAGKTITITKPHLLLLLRMVVLLIFHLLFLQVFPVYFGQL